MGDGYVASTVVMCVLFISGMIAGATGAFIGTPAEVSLIRMTSDGRLVSWSTCMCNRSRLDNVFNLIPNIIILILRGRAREELVSKTSQ